MKLFLKNNFVKSAALGITTILAFAACNKDLEEYPLNLPANPNAGLRTVGDSIISRPADSLFRRLLERGGWIDTLRNANKTFTVWVPDSNAIKQFAIGAAGGALPANANNAMVSAFIRTALPVASANVIASYHFSPQYVNYTTLSSNFPNVQVPTFWNPAPTVSAFLRMTVFPSPRNGNFLNNIPVTVANQIAGNGIMHSIAAVNVPPSSTLWAKINADTSYSYFAAAIMRADSGTTGTLKNALDNVGANLTVFAPTNEAFRTLLYAKVYPVVYGTIYAQAIAAGASTTAATAAATAQAPAATTAMVGTSAVFANPALQPYLTATTVKGLAVYHVMGVRAFLNNFPTTQANFPTLLNGAVASHPGIGLQATIAAMRTTAATVKGAVNATAANVLINPLPGGTSDQNYLNGVLHKIDQVLLPQ